MGCFAEAGKETCKMRLVPRIFLFLMLKLVIYRAGWNPAIQCNSVTEKRLPQSNTFCMPENLPVFIYQFYHKENVNNWDQEQTQYSKAAAQSVLLSGMLSPIKTLKTLMKYFHTLKKHFYEKNISWKKFAFL